MTHIIAQDQLNVRIAGHPRVVDQLVPSISSRDSGSAARDTLDIARLMGQRGRESFGGGDGGRAEEGARRGGVGERASEQVAKERLSKTYDVPVSASGGGGGDDSGDDGSGRATGCAGD